MYNKFTRGWVNPDLNEIIRTIFVVICIFNTANKLLHGDEFFSSALVEINAIDFIFKFNNSFQEKMSFKGNER